MDEHLSAHLSAGLGAWPPAPRGLVVAGFPDPGWKVRSLLPG